MTCLKCTQARRACNKEMVACAIWSGVYHGDQQKLMTVIQQTTDVGSNDDTKMMIIRGLYPKEEDKATEILIESLMEHYAPNPQYEGWADMGSKPGGKSSGMISNHMVLIEPESSCCLYKEYK